MSILVSHPRAPLPSSFFCPPSCGRQEEIIVTAGEDCRRFYVVLGAPSDLLAVGEIPAVSRESAGTAAAGTPSRRGFRLLAGQYFGEKGLLRQVEVGGPYYQPGLSWYIRRPERIL